MLATVLAQAALAQACSEAPLSPSEPPFEAEDPVPEQDPEPVVCDEGPFVRQAPVRLLTRFEYDNTVRDLLGEEASLGQAFPPENRTGVFDNDSKAHVVSPLLVQQYMEAAEALADRVIPSRTASLLECDLEVEGEQACGAAFIARFASRAFRRPAQAQERAIFERLFEEIRAQEGFEQALKLTVQAVLQSPQFLYRIELEGGEQGGEVAAGEVSLVGSYEMASRLSYFLWASMPDDELFEVAAAGRLSTAKEVEDEARRMLDDPKAGDAVRSFHRQWLHVSELPSHTKDQAIFPEYTEGLKADWPLSVDAFVEHVFFGEEPTLEALLTDPTLFMTPEMARVYGVEAPEASELVVHRAPDEERSGLLTQPALMAVLANANQGSPILRGIFVRERLFCQPLDPPPDDQEITPPDPSPDATTRERFAEHTSRRECAGCHALIDPIGFGFERYDGLGRFRDTENGLPIDDSGDLTGVEAALLGPFEGAVELSRKLSESEMVRDCVAQQWFTYALGRLPQGMDTCALEQLQADFSAEGGDMRALLLAIVRSDAFRYRVSQGPSVEEGGQ